MCEPGLGFGGAVGDSREFKGQIVHQLVGFGGEFLDQPPVNVIGCWRSAELKNECPTIVNAQITLTNPT